MIDSSFTLVKKMVYLVTFGPILFQGLLNISENFEYIDIFENKKRIIDFSRLQPPVADFIRLELYPFLNHFSEF